MSSNRFAVVGGKAAACPVGGPIADRDTLCRTMNLEQLLLAYHKGVVESGHRHLRHRVQGTQHRLTPILGEGVVLGTMAEYVRSQTSHERNELIRRAKGLEPLCWPAGSSAYRYASNVKGLLAQVVDGYQANSHMHTCITNALVYYRRLLAEDPNVEDIL